MARKHLARHNKPFKCDIDGCSKATEGFSTNNDLERHKRCVHKLRRGDETVYRCNVGSCRDKPKDWPRQDNFIQHLRRKHGLTNVDLAQYTFLITDTPDIATLGTAEDTAPEIGAVASPDMDAHFPWLGTSDKDHVKPANLMKKSPAYGQTHHGVHFPGHPHMEERGVAALRVDAQQHGSHNPPGSALSYHDTGRVPSELGIPHASSRGASIPATLSPTGVNQLAYVPPDFLGRSRMEVEPFSTLNTPGQPRHTSQLETGEARDVVREYAQPEREEAASGVPDAMDVDEPVRDPDSPDGLHDMDSEDDALPGSTLLDAQANLLRDTGAQYCGADEVQTKASPGEMQLGSEISRPINLDDEAEVSTYLESLRQRGTLGKILKKFGYSTPEEPESQDRKLPASAATQKGSGRRIYCQECNKGFNRPCELKKHQKRHEKPYACTFANCDKKFGSKNDWKRHENSQHFQLEIWRCAEQVTDPAGGEQQEQECGKVCHRAESLKAHLERDHGIRDQALLDRKLADCRMGRNFESRFWCGFCQTTIEPSGKGGPAHSERFDHIDDHFNGRGMPKADIKDWKYVDIDPLDSPACSPGGPETERWGDAGGGGGGGGGGSTTNPRKRHNTASDDDASAGPSKKSKRLRSSSSGKRGDVFWICCACGYYWTAAVNSQCMNESCNHAHCDACDSFENESTTERQIALPDQGSAAVGAGVGTT
ncbi:uncharacterized protein B0T15DRAFT_392374 [Chaetomium strumarium]|uniref:C2H2-type domain-containing protein n=1 Tax=Chaetomium strumarium TaxID=1170767 RepID=A0AAJ0H095_9PEZI|nr:hypothetical protein B0T15DRAFT_392374 [Chaetomium strumarium]